MKKRRGMDQERIRHIVIEITKVSKRKGKAKDFEKVDVCFRNVWVYWPYANRYKVELFNFLRHYRKDFFSGVDYKKFGHIIGIEDEEICFLLLGVGKVLGFWSLTNPGGESKEKYLFLTRSTL
jgi:hypothetical protein